MCSSNVETRKYKRKYIASLCAYLACANCSIPIYIASTEITGSYGKIHESVYIIKISDKKILRIIMTMIYNHNR